ncbi:MAG: chorismate mutase [Pseudomonadota bacterium]
MNAPTRDIAAKDTVETMEEVRETVDAIDRALVTLLVKRQAMMDAAARIKGERHLVLDRPRIEDVVSKVLAEAERQGLSAAIAEPVWRTLIDRCIAYEYQSFDALSPGLDKA